MRRISTAGGISLPSLHTGRTTGTSWAIGISIGDELWAYFEPPFAP